MKTLRLHRCPLGYGVYLSKVAAIIASSTLGKPFPSFLGTKKIESFPYVDQDVPYGESRAENSAWLPSPFNAAAHHSNYIPTSGWPLIPDSEFEWLRGWRTAAWLAALVLLVAINRGASAQASAPAPPPNPVTLVPAQESDCLTPVVTKLSSCIDFVNPASNKARPSLTGECCGGLEAFLEEDFDCICSLFNAEPEDYPIPVNRAKILSLPVACNLPFPTVRCTGKITTRLPGNRCLTPLSNSTAMCMDYVEPENTGKPPYNGDCCIGVRNFVIKEPSCVCSLFGDKPVEYVIPVDKAKGIQLSYACNAPFEEVAKCFASSSPPGLGPPKNAAKQSFTPPATSLISAASLAITSAFF